MTMQQADQKPPAREDPGVRGRRQVTQKRASFDAAAYNRALKVSSVPDLSQQLEAVMRYHEHGAGASKMRSPKTRTGDCPAPSS
jgi:hypothetical protein